MCGVWGARARCVWRVRGEGEGEVCVVCAGQGRGVCGVCGARARCVWWALGRRAFRRVVCCVVVCGVWCVRGEVRLLRCVWCAPGRRASRVLRCGVCGAR